MYECDIGTSSNGKKVFSETGGDGDQYAFPCSCLWYFYYNKYYEDALAMTTAKLDNLVDETSDPVSILRPENMPDDANGFVSRLH